MVKRPMIQMRLWNYFLWDFAPRAALSSTFAAFRCRVECCNSVVQDMRLQDSCICCVDEGKWDAFVYFLDRGFSWLFLAGGTERGDNISFCILILDFASKNIYFDNFVLPMLGSK